MIEPGDIRWYRFALPDKRRPVLVVARADIVSSLSDLHVIPLSTQMRGLAWEVPFGSSDGLPSACVLKPEWIRSVPRAQIGPRIASLAASRWPEVRSALLNVTGLAAPPGERIAPLVEATESFRRAYVLRAVDACSGNRSHAANLLGVDARTVFRYLERERE